LQSNKTYLFWSSNFNCFI